MITDIKQFLCEHFRQVFELAATKKKNHKQRVLSSRNFVNFLKLFLELWIIIIIIVIIIIIISIIIPGNNNSKDNNQYLYSIPQVRLLAGSLCFRKNNWASFASNFNQMYLFYEHLWHPALHAFLSKVVTYILPTVLSNDGIRNKITCLNMLWFDFILGLNFILLFQTHYLTLPYPKKQKKIKFKPRIKA